MTNFLSGLLFAFSLGVSSDTEHWRQCIDLTDETTFDTQFAAELGLTQAQLENYYEEGAADEALRESLAQSDLASDQVVLALLAREKTDAYQALGRAFELDPESEDAVIAATGICSTSDQPFCQGDWVNRYREHDPSNLDPYLWLLNDVSNNPELDTKAIIEQAAKKVDHLMTPWARWIILVGNAHQEHIGPPFDSLQLSLMSAVGVSAAWALPGFNALVEGCEAVELADACAAIGRAMMADSDTIIGTLLGGRIILDVADSVPSAVSSELLDAAALVEPDWDIIRKGHSLANCLLGRTAPNNPIQWTRDMDELGEWKTIEKQTEQLWAELERRFDLSLEQLEQGAVTMSQALTITEPARLLVGDARVVAEPTTEFVITEPSAMPSPVAAIDWWVASAIGLLVLGFWRVRRGSRGSRKMSTKP